MSVTGILADHDQTGHWLHARLPADDSRLLLSAVVGQSIVSSAMIVVSKGKDQMKEVINKQEAGNGAACIINVT